MIHSPTSDMLIIGGVLLALVVWKVLDYALTRWWKL